jgi:hypothetical protein
LPLLGMKPPVSRLMKVVLPAPFGPISAWRAPGSNVSETSLLAANAPQLLLRPSVRSVISLAHACSLRFDGLTNWIMRSNPPRMPPRANSTISTSSRPI